MWPGRVSNPGPLIYESGALPTALRGPAYLWQYKAQGKEYIVKRFCFAVYFFYFVPVKFVDACIALYS